MKVKCIDKKMPNQKTEYSSLTIGKEYIVLAIEAYDSTLTFVNAIGDFIAYRIIDNDGVVMLYPAKNFDIVSGKMPSNWITHRITDGEYSILPKTWAKEYFWDDFYNDNYEAVNEFKREIEIINSEEINNENDIN